MFVVAMFNQLFYCPCGHLRGRISLLTILGDCMINASTKKKAGLYNRVLLTRKSQLSGIGVHSGQRVDLQLLPATAGDGIIFKRTDLGGKTVKVSWDTVVDTRNCTTVGEGEGVTVSTIEHLMAAFFAYGIDDAVVEISGPELPIMDGSAKDFISFVRGANPQVNPDVSRRRIIVKQAVSVEGDNGRKASLSPSDCPVFEVEFDFDGENSIGLQRAVYKPFSESFEDLIGSARTFGLLSDAEKIWAMGLAKGASLDNTLVYDKRKIINESGERLESECAKHKILDAVGDLHLVGGMLVGHYHGVKTGHSLNNKLLRKLFSDNNFYEIV